MDDGMPQTDDSDVPRAPTPGFDRRRSIAGGLTLLGAVVGFTLVQAVIDAGSLPEEWVLVALPAFGIVGVVGFVVFVSSVVTG